MNINESNDNRHFHRILYTAQARVHGDDQPWDCEIIDLSLKGCLLSFSSPWQGDQTKLYTLTLKLSEEVEIRMGVSVTHVLANRVGFKCEHIDLDSISELRRLVELNLGSSDMLERDLQSLIGANPLSTSEKD